MLGNSGVKDEMKKKNITINGFPQLQVESSRHQLLDIKHRIKKPRINTSITLFLPMGGSFCAYFPGVEDSIKYKY